MPPGEGSAAADVLDFCRVVGIDLDPWQQTMLAAGLGERPDGRWSAFEVGLVVARQNGKGHILLARELAGAFVLGERFAIHSAHEYATSLEHMQRCLHVIEDSPDLDRRVKRVARAHGEEGIEFKNGARIRFRTRTRGGGRGFSADLVVLDEAFELPEAAMAALLPTLSAQPNPQLWLASSAVDQNMHPNGMVLSDLRRRALSDSPGAVAWCEWSVDEQRFWRDPQKVASDAQAWAQANPAMGFRIDRDHVERERDAMTTGAFAVERLSVGDWPAAEEAEHGPIDVTKWSELVDVRSQPLDPVVFGVDMTPDRSRTAIGVAGFREDGKTHVGLVEHRSGSGWVAARLLELIDRWGPAAVVVDGRSPAASLQSVLERAGVDPELIQVTTAGQMAAACGLLYDAVEQGTVRHLGSPKLDDAVAQVRTRTLGDAFAWARPPGGDISPLVAVTLAFGFAQRPTAKPPEPFAMFG